MTDTEERAIRAAAATHSAAKEREGLLMKRLTAGLDAVELAQLRGDLAVARVVTQRAWVALRKAQGFKA